MFDSDLVLGGDDESRKDNASEESNEREEDVMDADEKENDQEESVSEVDLLK